MVGQKCAVSLLVQNRIVGAPLAQCGRSAGAVQLFGRLAVLETHTLQY